MAGTSSTAKPPYSWTADETTSLVCSYEAGVSLEELSGRSGRSPHHVVVQLAWALCGVGRGDVNPMVPRFREPWSDTEHRALVDLHHRGVALAAIAAGLHRDLTDVAWRLVVERECLVGFTRAGSQS